MFLSNAMQSKCRICMVYFLHYHL